MLTSGFNKATDSNHTLLITPNLHLRYQPSIVWVTDIYTFPAGKKAVAGQYVRPSYEKNFGKNGGANDERFGTVCPERRLQGKMALTGTHGVCNQDGCASEDNMRALLDQFFPKEGL